MKAFVSRNVLKLVLGTVLAVSGAAGIVCATAFAPTASDQAQAATFTKAKASGGVVLTYTGKVSKVTVPAKYKGKKVVGFVAESKGLKTVNLKKAKYLKTLALKDNKLKEISLSKNTKLVDVNVSDNKLAKLSVSKLKKLKKLRCGANKLTKLSVSKNTKLVELDCCENALTKLSVSKNTKLKVLCVSDNKLKKLDVRKLTKLVELDVRDNKSLVDLYISRATPKSTLMLNGCSKLSAKSNGRVNDWCTKADRETDYSFGLAQ